MHLKFLYVGLVLITSLFRFSGASIPYLGIRYADMPQRWQRTTTAAFDPVLLLRRNSSQNVFGGGCHQFNEAPNPTESEDCFFLNVWSPDDRPVSNISCNPALGGCNLPVLFWIYGGGFQSGSAKFDQKIELNGQVIPLDNVVNGGHFADQGMIVVTFDFRMGALGYFKLPGNVTLSPGDNDFPSGGNIGVYDAITALEWVAKNIGYFGGDSSKVTVWGQSSGGMTAGLLMLSPLTKGLMSSVIMNSAPLPIAAWPCSNSEAATLRWAQQTRCAFMNGTGNWTSACFRSLTFREIYEATRHTGQTILLGPPNWAPNFSPCVDGQLISQPPLAIMLQGNYKKIPVIAGFTADEAYLFTMKHKNNISRYTAEYFNQTIGRFAQITRQYSLQPVPDDRFQAAVSSMRSIYVDDRSRSYFERWTDFISQVVFVCPLQLAVNALATIGPAPFGYDFYDPNIPIKTLHGLDVFYLWLPDSNFFFSLFLGCPSGPSCKLRDQMRQYLVNFVKSQSSPSPSNPSNSTVSAWSNVAQRANVSSDIYLRWDNTSGEYTSQYAMRCKSMFDNLLPSSLQFPPSPPPSTTPPSPAPPPTSPSPANSAPSVAAPVLSTAAIAGISVAAVVAAAVAAAVFLRLRQRKRSAVGEGKSMDVKLIIHA